MIAASRASRPPPDPRDITGRFLVESRARIAAAPRRIARSVALCDSQPLTCDAIHRTANAMAVRCKCAARAVAGRALTCVGAHRTARAVETALAR
jgi:hypothetical protein